jgi:SAM-dependent methyltransferase
MSSYDSEIRRHYQSVARETGLSPASTMADLRTRELETQLIIRFLDLARDAQDRPRRRLTRVFDVGCGNGYTLSVIQQKFPQYELHGFEFTDELRVLAESRFANGHGARIHPADVRARNYSRGVLSDVIIVQRVLINLMDAGDQQLALENILASLNIGGHVLFIEAFAGGLQILNEARAEFGIEPIPPAEHNFLLPDDFFSNCSRLMPFAATTIPSNFLSTHYFTTRVLHPLALSDRPFVRNSHFVSFMSQALAQNVGDYSPVRAFAFMKSSS